MAAEDYNVADREGWQGTDKVTAGDKVGETVFDNPDNEAQAAADAAGVSSAAYIDYAAALDAHQSRSDIETLADRRAREAGDAFADADFMRATPDGVAPTPGTPDGIAPASA